MFRNRPVVEHVAAGKFVVREPLVWASRDDLADSITVPAGFPTDLASIPRFLRDRKPFDPNGPSFPAGILHDFLYATGKFGKAFADELLYVSLRTEGVSAPIAWAYYKAVDWFGHAAYREHEQRRRLARKSLHVVK
jgi:hypothetical protein